MQTPLRKKLGYQNAFRTRLFKPPKGYLEWIEPLPEGVTFPDDGPFDLVHIFSNEKEEFTDQLLTARQQIVPNGMIWVSWYKKASGLPSELTEDIIREAAIAHRLVDVKVCRINDQWSGLKLVIPVKYR